MNILLLSAYDAMSHRYWREGLCSFFDNHHWVCLTLPPRFFSWRIRGNPLSWLDAPELKHHYDLLIATSMVDLSVLRGLIPSLAKVPTVQYFHENQFAYPTQGNQRALEPKMVSIYSALAADKLLFNSHFNLNSFFDGLAATLNQFPDFVPKNVPAKMRSKASVIPVPLQDKLFKPAQCIRKNAVLNLVWNHRWEYDKGIDRLLRMAALLPDAGLVVHIVGQHFRQVPAEFSQLKTLLEQKGILGHWGFIEDTAQYRSLLSKSDVVLSTAVHDFQGLSVMEAVALGCVPLVPNRLAYTELFEEHFRYTSDLQNLTREAESLVGMLTCLIKAYPNIPSPPDMTAWSWAVLGPKYGDAFTQLLASPHIAPVS